MFIECISFKLEVSKECQIKHNLKEAKWKNYHAKIVQSNRSKPIFYRLLINYIFQHLWAWCLIYNVGWWTVYLKISECLMFESKVKISWQE